MENQASSINNKTTKIDQMRKKTCNNNSDRDALLLQVVARTISILRYTGKTAIFSCGNPGSHHRAAHTHHFDKHLRV